MKSSRFVAVTALAFAAMVSMGAALAAPVVRDIPYAPENGRFVDKDGNISLDLTIDYLHPTAKGYDLWAEALAPIIEEEVTKR